MTQIHDTIACCGLAALGVICMGTLFVGAFAALAMILAEPFMKKED